MPKVLKPYTIIPPELYVQRDADRQIRNIINDMGRPGYVLVSRQMGKTNLLLNAKRNLETLNDVFVYIDLSNPFDNAQSCFQNIIDTAYETNQERFSEVYETIIERRKELVDTPAHKQHTNELRYLLRAIKGKLVIILDEIDALTKTQYSDQIFAQIRSIYFSRVNFKELENLTYILSGVIEPNEIIKDPKISPFNIGQKIFLNDFSQNEFNQFIDKARLDINAEIRDKIFYWTNGNPRITWEVCSELENVLKSESVTISAIDKIVNDIYLISFDRPPIDNIREIVKNDRELRSSIFDIQNRKGKEVSDKIKNKLYLAGIINYEDNEIHIKNEIIKKSLSLEWLKSLDEDEKGLIGVAFEHYENGRYAEALLNFEKFLENATFPDRDSDICFYYMGYSIFLQGNYSRAVEYYDKAKFDIEDSPKLHFNKENLKGLAYVENKEYSKSIKCYEYVIANSKKDENYLRATINLGHLYMNKYTGDTVDSAIELFENIISDKFTIASRVKSHAIDYYKSLAFYNLAEIYKSRGVFETAKKYITLGLPIADNHTKSSLLLLLAEVTSEALEKTKILKELIFFFCNNNVEPDSPSPDKPLDLNTVQVRDVLLNLFVINEYEFLDTLNTNSSLFINKKKSEYLLELAIHAFNNNKWEVCYSILNLIYRDSKNGTIEIDYSTNYTILKLLSTSPDNKKTYEKHLEYISLFESNNQGIIDYLDFEIFSDVIYFLIDKKRYTEALHNIKIISKYISNINDDLLINYLVIFHFEITIYQFLGNKIKASLKAKEIIDFINSEKLNNKTSNLLGDKGFEIIKNNAESVLNPIDRTPLKPFQRGKKYGRNEIVKVRYKDGVTLEAKFKKVEEDLSSGECIILN